MLSPPDDPPAKLGHASIAWPLDMLYDERGTFVGYLMPYVQNAVTALKVFNPRRPLKKIGLVTPENFLAEQGHLGPI
jgi:DNA-binding helix-hairpin-helix protein with protein kinase domain